MTRAASKHRAREQIIMTLDDAAIMGAAALAVFWEVFVPMIPDTLRGLVLLLTVVYVAFRAVNEIRRFFEHKADK